MAAVTNGRSHDPSEQLAGSSKLGVRSQRHRPQPGVPPHTRSGEMTVDVPRTRVDQSNQGVGCDPGAPGSRPLRIGLHDFSGHPFQVQLSRRLASRGHEVIHWHCPAFLTGKGALNLTGGDPQTLRIEPIHLERGFSKYSIRRRIQNERAYGGAIAAAVARSAPDVVMSSNNPLLSQQALLRSCERLGIPFIFWQQDIYSVAMTRIATARYPLIGNWIGRYFSHLEASMLRRSDAVIPISDDFLPALRAWGVPADRITMIENWAPIDELPTAPRDNPWAREHGLADRQVILYSGTLGLKHNPSMLAELANRYRNTDVVVVVISEGPGADFVRRAAREGDLDNLLVLPFQPFDALPLVFASADILVAILEADAGIYSVPSKVLSYHCAGRAILAAVPRSNLAARIVDRVGSGIVADPTSPSSVVAAAGDLLGDRAMRDGAGARAREYAEEAFDIEKITDRFERIITRVASASATRTQSA
jgi:colanic acid biosynthesis glycosyl transferase WcaI